MLERIEHPRLTGLDDWSLGLDFAMFSIFYRILSLIKGKYSFFVLFTIQVCLGLKNDAIHPRLND